MICNIEDTAFIVTVNTTERRIDIAVLIKCNGNCLGTFFVSTCRTVYLYSKPAKKSVVKGRKIFFDIRKIAAVCSNNKIRSKAKTNVRITAVIKSVWFIGVVYIVCFADINIA